MFGAEGRSSTESRCSFMLKLTVIASSSVTSVCCRRPAGFVWNGLWVLELAAVGDSRVVIEGDVKLELTSFRPHDSRSAAVADARVFHCLYIGNGWLGSRVVGVLDSGAEGPGFKSQSRRCRVTVLGKLFTPIVPLFTKQQNW